jgi:hypothetical protein
MAIATVRAAAAPRRRAPAVGRSGVVPRQRDEPDSPYRDAEVRRAHTERSPHREPPMRRRPRRRGPTDRVVAIGTVAMPVLGGAPDRRSGVRGSTGSVTASRWCFSSPRAVGARHRRAHRRLALLSRSARSRVRSVVQLWTHEGQARSPQTLELRAVAGLSGLGSPAGDAPPAIQSSTTKGRSNASARGSCHTARAR